VAGAVGCRKRGAGRKMVGGLGRGEVAAERQEVDMGQRAEVGSIEVELVDWRTWPRSLRLSKGGRFLRCQVSRGTATRRLEEVEVAAAAAVGTASEKRRRTVADVVVVGWRAEGERT
jgi:hypothetical protein